MRRLAFALAIFTSIVIFATRAPAGAGSICMHQTECGDPHRFVCVADCETCSVGHCVKLRVLP